MITFEEAIKKLNISKEELQNAKIAGMRQCVVLESESRKSFLGFILENRNLMLQIKEDDCLKYTMIEIVFTDESTKKFYPLATDVAIKCVLASIDIIRVFWSKLWSSKQKELNEERQYRLLKLGTIVGINDEHVKYTKFGEGVRAVYNVLTLPEGPECDSYKHDIVTKTFDEIRTEIVTLPECCPLCNSSNIKRTGEDFSEDTYWEDMICNNCKATWTLNYNYAYKTAIKDKDGTTIIPTNQEVNK